jgi:hypothetical protein
MADDTFYYPSSGDEAYYAKLRQLTDKYPHDLRHYLDLFAVYTNRRSLIRQLAHYELFKLTVELPGHYLDFGVYFGKSYFTWHKLIEIFTPTATHKKVIGFDTFAGFPALAPEDGPRDATIQKNVGGLSSASFLAEFRDLLALHNQDAVLPVGRGTIIQGDVCKTLPQWLDENQEARICLCNLDMDLYEPTAAILEGCWDRIVPGGVLILDEYATSKWPGETKAWDDFATKRGLNIPLKRFSFANAPGAYVIKP